MVETLSVEGETFAANVSSMNSNTGKLELRSTISELGEKFFKAIICIQAEQHRHPRPQCSTEGCNFLSVFR